MVLGGLREPESALCHQRCKQEEWDQHYKGENVRHVVSCVRDQRYEQDGQRHKRNNGCLKPSLIEETPHGLSICLHSGPSLSIETWGHPVW